MEDEGSFSCLQGPPLVPILSPINSAHVLPSYFKLLFNIIILFKTSLPCGLFPLGLSTKIGYLLLFSAVSTRFAGHLIVLGSEDPKNNWWNTKTEELQ
jgi:hypothetical protein